MGGRPCSPFQLAPLEPPPFSSCRLFALSATASLGQEPPLYSGLLPQSGLMVKMKPHSVTRATRSVLQQLIYQQTRRRRQTSTKGTFFPLSLCLWLQRRWSRCRLLAGWLASCHWRLSHGRRGAKGEGRTAKRKTNAATTFEALA